ncbi:hypothetical protein [Rhodococcoides fascians]|uniref:hypothetical protein n=1 Tax=Rhodococcoides fascians TaxID=1828 RepID=UPI000B094816|nr:hypothetical protein [Rhodococcus fascians]
MVATYRDQHGNTVQVHQRAGRRALERLGYTLLEGDEHDDANDPGLPPAPVPPAASTPNVTDIVERGDVSGSAVTETNPLGEVKLTPDAEPTGAPAPWTAEAESVAAGLQTTGDTELVDVRDVEPEPVADVEPEPDEKPKRRSPRRGKAAAADE